MNSVLALFAVLVGFVSAQGVEKCPAGLPRDQYLVVNNSLCYEFVVYRGRAYASAENDCKVNGGILAVVKDQATQNFIYGKIKELYSGNKNVWIGLTDRASEGTYKWSDGMDLVYENWGSNDGPNNYFGAPLSDCVAIDPSTGVWEDFHCDNDLVTLFQDVNFPYICQFDLTS